MKRPRFHVDFNELVERDLVLLSQSDMKRDAGGVLIGLSEGLAIEVYEEDLDTEGKPDDLIASGVVERNRNGGWARHVKWCCRIDANGIRHGTELKESKSNVSPPCVIPGRRAAVNPETMNTGLWNMDSGFAACGRAPE